MARVSGWFEAWLSSEATEQFIMLETIYVTPKHATNLTEEPFIAPAGDTPMHPRR